MTVCNDLKNINHKYLTLRTGVNSKGLTTLYFFDVWEWKISKALFDKISVHKSTYVVSSFPIKSPGLNVADHCVFLDKENQLPLLLPSEGLIRISMAALVKISFEGQSILLIQNKTIKPFGGAYFFKEKPPIPSLKLDKDNSKDLRFTVNVSELELIKDWFNNKQGRELSPERELIEELCEENNILNKIDLI